MRPNPETLQRTCETLSPEHCLYPRRFLQAFGLTRYVMCEELRYNGQRRRDVPVLASGTLYIDVGDRAPRRKRHSFHHELWHMVRASPQTYPRTLSLNLPSTTSVGTWCALGVRRAVDLPGEVVHARALHARTRVPTARAPPPPQVDFHLLGNAFEAHDAEWCKFNPPNFKYGHGGKSMRSDSSSSQLSSAPAENFLNRYSTSSIAEDKAEIWAALMCYQQILKSPSLKAKARLLQKRARQLCSQMDDAWWAKVVEAQQKLVDHWEVHYVDSQRGRAFWCNWVTEEKRWSKPVEAASVA